MKSLGVILHTIHNGNIIARSDRRVENIKMNTIVLNNKLQKIGKIIEKFGPVDKPYFSIKPFKTIIITQTENKKIYIK